MIASKQEYKNMNRITKNREADSPNNAGKHKKHCKIGWNKVYFRYQHVGGALWQTILRRGFHMK